MFKKALVLAVALASFVAYAAEPTGTWTGKVQIDTSKLPADKKKMVEATTKNLRITLILKKDHTFTSTVAGSNDGKPHSTSGTWTFKGNSVNLTAKMNDGKPATTSSTRSMALGKDGKSLVMSIASPPAKAGQPSPPKVQVVFKKSA